MQRLKGRLLLDTKPLTRLLLECMGLEGDVLSSVVARLGLPLASVWPVFTETLYFIGKRLKQRRDRAELLPRLRNCLERVGEIPIAFHDAARRLDEEVDIADTALLQALQAQPTTLVTEDARLAGKARRRGLQAVTVYELLALTTT